MKPSRFDLFMTSIDDSLLEEALQPHSRKQRMVKIIIPFAACFCLIVGIWFLLLPHTRPVTKNPVIANDLHILNYNLPQLNSLTHSIDYALYDYGEDYELPLAEAVLTLTDNRRYTVRSLKTASSTDISGLTTQEVPLVWAYGPLEFQLCSNGTFSWLSWYSAETQLQYCISTDGDSAILLQTATDIVEILGYDMAVSPDGATDVNYQVFLYNGLTVAETSFSYEGTLYRFRMASTPDVSIPFADISGSVTTYDTHVSGEVLWCPAELDFTEGNAGKIIWFDVVPGLLYSLTADDRATESTLLSMAEMLFRPAQEGN